LVSQTQQLQRNQTTLHHQLKEYYRTDLDGEEEVTVNINGNNFRIDVLNKERNIACEIHRANFGKQFSQKLVELLSIPEMKIIIVYPVVNSQKVTRRHKKNILSVSHYNRPLSKYSLFNHLVRIKIPFHEDQMEFHLHLIKEHVIKEFIGFYGRSTRRRYKTSDREIISLSEVLYLKTKKDFSTLLPSGLPDKFTNKDLAKIIADPKVSQRQIQRLAGRITYSLWKLEVLARVGKIQQAFVYSLNL
jgi:hypothetical protein